MTTLYVLTVAYAGNVPNVVLTYRSKERAETAQNKITPLAYPEDEDAPLYGAPFIRLEDDFGVVAHIDWDELRYVTVLDMERSFEVQVEQAIMQQVAQTKAQNRMENLNRLSGRSGPGPFRAA